MNSHSSEHFPNEPLAGAPSSDDHLSDLAAPTEPAAQSWNGRSDTGSRWRTARPAPARRGIGTTVVTLEALLRQAVNAPSRRRRDSRGSASPRCSLHIPTPVVAVGMLLIGLLCGVLLMRQRRAAQEVVLSVNGSLLKQDEMNRRLQSSSAPPVAHKWIQEEMWLQFARQKHALPTPAEVDARYMRLTKDPAFAAAQQTSAKSPEEIKRSLQVQLAQVTLLSGNVQANEADARAFYAQNSDSHNPHARYFVPETLTAQILVTRTQQAGELARQRIMRGENFAVLVHELSRDVSSQQGGTVTIVRNRGRYSAIPGMETTLFGMKIGGLTGPQKFAGYWWIIRCTDRQPKHVLPYEQVAEDCRLGARLKKGVPHTLKQVQTEFAAFQKSARVEAFWPQVVSGQSKP